MIPVYRFIPPFFFFAEPPSLAQPRLLEKQEARRRAAKPKIREQSPEAPPRAKRKGEEVYYDEVRWGWDGEVFFLGGAQG